jgi:hypothetical protein
VYIYSSILLYKVIAGKGNAKSIIKREKAFFLQRKAQMQKKAKRQSHTEK